MIEQAKFTYSRLGNTFEKQIKTTENQGRKKVETLKDLKPKEHTKTIKNKPKERATIIFNDLVNKRKKN